MTKDSEYYKIVVDFYGISYNKHNNSNGKLDYDTYATLGKNMHEHVFSSREGIEYFAANISDDKFHINFFEKPWKWYTVLKDDPEYFTTIFSKYYCSAYQKDRITRNTMPNTVNAFFNKDFNKSKYVQLDDISESEEVKDFAQWLLDTEYFRHAKRTSLLMDAGTILAYILTYTGHNTLASDLYTRLIPIQSEKANLGLHSLVGRKPLAILSCEELFMRSMVYMFGGSEFQPCLFNGALVNSIIHDVDSHEIRDKIRENVLIVMGKVADRLHLPIDTDRILSQKYFIKTLNNTSRAELNEIDYSSIIYGLMLFDKNKAFNNIFPIFWTLGHHYDSETARKYTGDQSKTIMSHVLNMMASGNVPPYSVQSEEILPEDINRTRRLCKLLLK